MMLTIATIQSSIGASVGINGAHIRGMMRRASASGAELAHFPEGALSGYAGQEIWGWDSVNWDEIEAELASIGALARELGLWVCLGSAHALPAPHRPHNSIWVISDQGKRVHRYDKRMCSNSEVTYWFTPGRAPLVFDVAGIRLGVAICIEAAFPALFAEYEAMQVQCMLVSCYSADPAHGLMARAHAATNCYWLSLSTPMSCSATLPSQGVGPEGDILAQCAPGSPGMALFTIDPDALQYQIPLHFRRPWRARARSGEIYAGLAVD